MIHKGLKLVLFAGVTLAAIGLLAPAANAGWWWGAAPAYGGCDTCGCGGYSVCGACGGCGGHHHCGHRGGCGCGGSWTGWSSCCSCYSTWAPCGCGCDTCGVSSCGCGGMTSYPAMGTTGTGSIPTPAAPPTLAPNPAPTSGVTSPSSTAAPVPPVTPPTGLTPPSIEGPGGVLPTPGHGASLDQIREDGCLLTVWVPYEAKVTINGIQTKSTGTRRQFVSYGLRPGYSYTYEVVAKVVREGREYTDKKTIALTAGDRNGVAFGFNIPTVPTESQTASN